MTKKNIERTIRDATEVFRYMFSDYPHNKGKGLSDETRRDLTEVFKYLLEAYLRSDSEEEIADIEKTLHEIINPDSLLQTLEDCDDLWLDYPWTHTASKRTCRYDIFDGNGNRITDRVTKLNVDTGIAQVKMGLEGGEIKTKIVQYKPPVTLRPWKGD